jgi:hypothetical protein
VYVPALGPLDVGVAPPGGVNGALGVGVDAPGVALCVVFGVEVLVDPQAAMTAATVRAPVQRSVVRERSAMTVGTSVPVR